MANNMMVRQEQPKEDLIRQATAWDRRVEFACPNETVVVGLTQHGSVSLCFDDEPIFQFNSQGELRRVFDAGIIKAERGRLVRLTKRRTSDTVNMHRATMSDRQQKDYLDQLLQRMCEFQRQIDRGAAVVTRQVPDTFPAVESVTNWLLSIVGSLETRGEEAGGSMGDSVGGHRLVVAQRPNTK